MKKGDTNLAIILIALLLVIASVSVVLAPSLTGFSYFSLEPEHNTIETAPSRAKSLITAYAIKAIPSKDTAVIIASAIFLVMLGYLMYRLVRRRSLIEPEESAEHAESGQAESAQTEKIKITGEVTADAVLNLNQELSTKKRTDNSSYADELDKIQRELDSL